jgi:malonyl-CoA O-methyltransferase
MFKKRKKAEPTKTREAYALWAPSYPPEAHNPLMEAEQKALMDLFPPLNGLCLDLGCGSGRYLKSMEEKGARAMGLDLSLEMLKKAAGHCSSPLIAGSMDRLPYKNESFDAIVCSLCVGHAPDLNPFAREAARVLRPGGWLLYSDFHPFLALHGLERTFRDSKGRLRSVEHYVHLYGAHQRALSEAGLFITHVVEPLGEIEKAGLPKNGPIVLVIRAEKP